MANKVYGVVRDRDFNCCRVCGSPHMVEVHHILFRSQGGPDEEWNLISLCKLCHMRAHGVRTPRLKKDMLHSMVELGISGEREIKTCRTCANRSSGFVCAITNVLMNPVDSCPQWTEN